MANIEKVRLSESEKIFSNEIKYESYLRSLTDDFSVVDRVLGESKNEEDWI